MQTSNHLDNSFDGRILTIPADEPVENRGEVAGRKIVGHQVSSKACEAFRLILCPSLQLARQSHLVPIEVSGVTGAAAVYGPNRVEPLFVAHKFGGIVWDSRRYAACYDLGDKRKVRRGHIVELPAQLF